MKNRFAWLVAVAVLGMLVIASRIKRVDLEGDHTSYLVLAPRPTLRFVYGGGEEGAWKRKHPGEKEPWWLAGRYVILMELTDS